MGDKNPIRTLGDYSKPSHEGYKSTIELLVGNNVVPLRSDTIRLLQNECSFHELRSEDPNQHLNDFLKLMDSLDLDGENKERTRMRNGYSLKDKNKAKTDKTKHGNGKSVKSQSQNQKVKVKANDVCILNGSTRTQDNGP
ncbi:hypothetical protein Tco_1398187, partial [Tanacetum coccineum]